MTPHESMALVDESWRRGADDRRGLGRLPGSRRSAWRAHRAALGVAAPDTQRKIAIAAAFHDLGIWSAGTMDYLPPSAALARD